MTEETARISPTADFPSYQRTRAFLEAVNGLDHKVFQNMWGQIWGQRGTPQGNIDWSKPEVWIAERLTGPEREMALLIWQKSNELVNPRYMNGYWNLAIKYNLLESNQVGPLKITPTGHLFLNEPDSSLVAEIDQQEGLFNLLQIISEHNPGKRSDILPDWVQYCNSYTTYQSESVHKGSLYDRLINLIDRDFVNRSGIFYSITDLGLAYLQKHAGRIIGRNVTTKQSELQRLSRTITKEARQQLAEFLASMDPYKFEHLVQLLLQEMGYTNVNVTSPSNDKGVDVIADIELGISSVREVVQVKRFSGTINRPVLDQLRGSLHRFNAMRGTIITTGTFTPGSKTAALEHGAAPITLIDGGKLVELLIQYEIGVTKKTVDFFEFDKSKLQQFEENNS